MSRYLRPYFKNTEVALPGNAVVRVMTYNVLAQSLIRRTQYPDNGSAIKWATRFPILADEIKQCSPDLLFLQEVDVAKRPLYTQIFEELDLDHIFLAGPEKSHGVTIAWRRSKFTLLPDSVTELRYDDLQEIPSQVVSGNVGLLTVLEHNQSKIKYLVGTSHLYWHPRADYERFRQLSIFLDKAMQLREQGMKVIIGADLNSTPSSPAYKFAINSSTNTLSQVRDQLNASASSTGFGQLGARPDQERPTLLADAEGSVRQLLGFADSSIKRRSDLQLSSCYLTVLKTEPQFTNWTTDFRDTIDYLLVSEDVNVLGVLALPSAEEMGEEPSSLPRKINDKLYPSDHILLLADIN